VGRRFSGAGGNAKQFEYDEENRLVAVYASDGASPPLHEYLYDALGRRILTHDHTPATAVQTRHAYGAGFEVLAEYESSDNWETDDLAREFLWGTGLHRAPTDAPVRECLCGTGLNPVCRRTPRRSQASAYPRR
jgi:hypothetical protein